MSQTAPGWYPDPNGSDPPLPAARSSRAGGTLGTVALSVAALVVLVAAGYGAAVLLRAEAPADPWGSADSGWTATGDPGGGTTVQEAGSIELDTPLTVQLPGEAVLSFELVVAQEGLYTFAASDASGQWQGSDLVLEVGDEQTWRVLDDAPDAARPYVVDGLDPWHTVHLEAGTYELLLSDYAGQDGDVRLTVASGGPVPLLEPGPQSFDFRPGEYALAQVYLTQGQELHLTAEAAGPADLVLAVWDPTGWVVENDDAEAATTSPTDPALTLAAPVDGIYVVLVAEHDGEAGRGMLEVTVR